MERDLLPHYDEHHPTEAETKHRAALGGLFLVKQLLDPEPEPGPQTARRTEARLVALSGKIQERLAATRRRR